jgi:hypothetical protein
VVLSLLTEKVCSISRQAAYDQLSLFRISSFLIEPHGLRKFHVFESAQPLPLKWHKDTCIGDVVIERNSARVHP